MASRLKSNRDLVEYVANETGLSQDKTKAAIRAVFDGIKKICKENTGIVLTGVGTFRMVRLKERPQRNPQTGEMMQLPAKNKLRFTQSGAVKEYMNS